MGRYQAEVEPTANADTAKIENVRNRLVAEPEALDISGDGTFVTTRGTRTVWEGKWRINGDRLNLRAERTQGVDVLPALQADIQLDIRSDGTLVDGRFSADGYALVFKKR